MRQNVKRRMRNFPVRSELKTLVKKELTLIKEGNAEEAAKFLPKVYSIIDMACKRNILHPNTAARKKSLLARQLSALQANGGAASTEAEKPVKKAAPKKAEKSVEEEK